MNDNDQEQSPDEPTEEPQSTEPEETTEQRTYQCPECDKTFDKVGSLNLHINTVHRRPSAPKTDFCPECGSGPYTKTDLKIHFKKKHARSEHRSEPIPSPSTSDTEPVEESTDVPIFKGEKTEAIKRRRRLIDALEIFSFRDKSKSYIMRMWDAYPDIRSDEREFYTLLMELDEIEPYQVRRIVDLVFGGSRDTPPTQDYYYHRGRPSSRPDHPDDYYYPRGRRDEVMYPQYGYSGYPPRPDIPMYPPNPYRSETPDGMMSKEVFELRLELQKKQMELERKDEQLEMMNKRISALENAPSVPPALDDAHENRIRELEKQLEETKREKQINEIRSQMNSQVSALQRELQDLRRQPRDIIDTLAERGVLGSRNTSMSDSASVAMKEIDAKLSVMNKGIDKVGNIIETWMTLSKPMKPSKVSDMTDEEKEVINKELG